MNNELEQSALYASLMGQIPLDSLKPHLPQFSKEGKMMVKAMTWLVEHGETPPFPVSSVKLTCTEVLGWDKSTIEPYLKQLWTYHSGGEVESILKGATDKFRLLEISNLVSKQLSDGLFDPVKFTDLVQQSAQESFEMKPLSEESQTWEENNGAARIVLGDRFPRLQEETGGLSGFWVVGGVTGTGKSTLAWQFSLIAGRERPVLYYDLENTSKVLYARTVQALDGDKRMAAELLRRIYVRTEPREVFREVYQLGQPCLVVLDSLQKLPSDVHVKRETMEEWLARLDRLKHQGHIVIVVSQLNRGAGEYKGTNDIEHTADFGIKLDSHEDNPLMSNVWIEKNRHSLARGWFSTLRRENSWLWRENG